MVDHLEYTYKNAERDCKILFNKIKLSKYNVDYILGVSVGGLLVSLLMGRLLKTKNILTIGIASYDGKVQKELKIINKPCKEYLENKNVLVVDDISDNGTTFEFVKNLLIKEYNVKSMKTLSLLINKDHCKKCHPDYYASETNKWVDFSWDKFE